MPLACVSSSTVHQDCSSGVIPTMPLLVFTPQVRARRRGCRICHERIGRVRPDQPGHRQTLDVQPTANAVRLQVRQSHLVDAHPVAETQNHVADSLDAGKRVRRDRNRRAVETQVVRVDPGHGIRRTPKQTAGGKKGREDCKDSVDDEGLGIRSHELVFPIAS